MIYIKKIYPAPPRKIELYRGIPRARWERYSDMMWRPIVRGEVPNLLHNLNVTAQKGRVTTRSGMFGQQYIYIRISEEEATMLLFQSG